MATDLVGNRTPGGGTLSSDYFIATPRTAVDSGTLNHIYVRGKTVASNVKIGIYDAAGNILNSGEFFVDIGDNDFTFPNTAITNGLLYYFGYIQSQNNMDQGAGESYFTPLAYANPLPSSFTYSTSIAIGVTIEGYNEPPPNKRYWIGGTGSWNDTAHWSTSSGGAGGAAVPTIADDVILDANSFSGTGQVLTLTDVTALQCLSFDASAVTNNPELNFSAGLGVSGAFILSPTMTTSATGDALTVGVSVTPSTDVNIDTQGHLIPSFSISGNGGGIAINLISDLNVTSTLFMGASGDFYNTNNHTISAGGIELMGGADTFNFGTSTININGFSGSSIFNGFVVDDATHIINGGNSVIKLNYTPNKLSPNNGDIGLFGQSIGEVQLLGSSSASEPYQFIGSGTLTKLTLQAGNKLVFDGGSTWNINNLASDGAANNLIGFASATPGTQYTINAGTVSTSYIDVKDCIAQGTIPFNDVGGTDNGNNLNWHFASGPVLSTGNIGGMKRLGLYKF